MMATSVPSSTHSGAGDTHVSGASRQSGSTGDSARLEQPASGPKVGIMQAPKLQGCMLFYSHVVWPRSSIYTIHTRQKVPRAQIFTATKSGGSWGAQGAGVCHGGLDSSNPVELILRHLTAWQAMLANSTYPAGLQNDITGGSTKMLATVHKYTKRWFFLIFTGPF